MEAMRAPQLVKISVSRIVLRDTASFHATMTVAFTGQWPAVLKLSPCVRTAEIWMTLSVMASVTLTSQELRTLIDGLVPMAPRGVSSRRPVVTGLQIVTMPLK